MYKSLNKFLLIISSIIITVVLAACGTKSQNKSQSESQSKLSSSREVLEKYSEVVNNVKSFNPSYVFYTRPYDEYLPQLYRSYVVSSYSCVCYTSYIGGLTLSHDFFCLSSDFRRFCGIFFATSNEEADNQKHEFSEIFNRNLAKTVVVGFPNLV